MRELGETTDISTGPSEAMCSIYGYKISDVNRVRYEMLIKGAESRDIQSTKDTLVLHTTNTQQSRNRWKVIGNGLLLHWVAKETAPQAVLELLSANHTKMQHMDVSL